MQFSFVKLSLATNPNLSYCRHILLQGEDRLLLLEKRGKFRSEFKWKHLKLPFGYLKDNWPINLVSISRDGNSIAVAGKCGFTIFNLLTNKWRLFSDSSEEGEIQCVGLSWYRQIVIVTNYKTTNEYEIIFFPNTQLRNSNILLRVPIPHKRIPLYLDCNDEYLLLYTTDSFCYQYRIIEQGTPGTNTFKISLQSIQHIMLSNETRTPVSILLLPSNTFQQLVINHAQMKEASKTLNLETSGKLLLSTAEKWFNIILAENVEQFWMANTEMEDLGNTMWAYGKRGLQVWFPFFSEDADFKKDKLTAESTIPFDPEVYPIGFIPEWAVIVGISQQITFEGVSNMPWFHLEAKTHPFLHSVLRRKIDSNQIPEAISLATKYTYVPHFSMTLELLLHETLESQYSNWKAMNHRKALEGSSKDISRNTTTNTNTSEQISEDSHCTPNEALHRVIEFLKNFPTEYPAVVVRCARKTDTSLWDWLFEIADKPADLFQKSIAIGDATTAASYLRIILLTEGSPSARKAALKVLELALEQEDVPLQQDLMRFLQPEPPFTPERF